MVKGSSGDDALSGIGEPGGELSDGCAGDAAAEVEYLPGSGEEGEDAILEYIPSIQGDQGGHRIS
jgi:hypothetical protein